MPTLILQIWLLGLFSFVVVGAVIYLGREWWLDSWGWDPLMNQSVFRPDFGFNESTALLAAAIVLLAIALFGGSLVKGILRLVKGSRKSASDPRVLPIASADHQYLKRPDGSEIHVEFYGTPEAPPLILTHGWGLHGVEWNYLKADLAEHFRLIVWDEPGLGRSKPPRNRDFSLEKFARDLDAVVSLAGSHPVILVGHSIGGMIIQTFCRLFPDTLRSQVAGIVFTHTTHTNPLRTIKGCSFYLAIEKPILRPLMWLTIGLSPLARLMTWLSYRNGTAHLSTMRSSFAGTENWHEIDFAAHFTPQAPPWVLARGMLGMLDFDETATLPDISVPTLVVAADKDTTTLPAASERIRAGIPRARLLTLSPGKHLGLIEQREAYAKAVREFAMSLGSATSTGSPAVQAPRDRNAAAGNGANATAL